MGLGLRSPSFAESRRARMTFETHVKALLPEDEDDKVLGVQLLLTNKHTLAHMLTYNTTILTLLNQST